MDMILTIEDKKCIKDGIRRKYAKVADSPEGLFKYPTGHAALEVLSYDPEILRALPADAVASYCGVGNPFSLGTIHEGESVLDVGCGCGVDTLVAAIMAGPTGSAVGIDMSPDMLERAKRNLQETSLTNVAFQEASAEHLPFSDESFAVLISNGAFNLIPHKAKALGEAFRVLKPGGRLMIADNVLTGELPDETKAKVEAWAKWEGGAIPGKDFLALLETAGFRDAEQVAETGFDSSPLTKGTLFRATKTRWHRHSKTPSDLWSMANNKFFLLFSLRVVRSGEETA